MRNQSSKKNKTLQRAGSVMLSFFLMVSLLMPNALSVWAEENTSFEDGLSYETEETVPAENQEVTEDVPEESDNSDEAGEVQVQEEVTDASEETGEADEEEPVSSEEAGTMDEEEPAAPEETDETDEPGILRAEEQASEENDAAEPDGLTDWEAMQKQIDDLYGQDETTITLTEDLTAGADDKALHVMSGVRLILDLNGHTINRNLQDPAEDGSVIVVDGRLTVTDTAGGGTITGGNTTGNGGGIINNSTLNLNGGTVTGNYAQGNGGGILNNSALNIDGGTVSGNEAGGLGGGVYNNIRQNMIIYSGTITGNEAGENAGGVWFESGGNQGMKGVLIINGKADITGNTAGGRANNVYLHGESKISITQRFDRESLIGVTTEEKPEEGVAVDVTKTNKDRSSASNFRSDDPQYGIFQELEDEVKLVVPVKVSFESGHEDATGEMPEVTAGKGVEYTAPSCGFDLERGAFTGWYVNGDTETIVKKGEKLTFTEDAVLTAAWDVSAWKELQSRIDHAADGVTITLDKDVEALSDDGALYIGSDKNIILDLNGHTIDRKLSEKEAVRNGYVIKVDGKLTIMDSSEAETGTITGGNDVSTGSQADAAGGILVNRGEFTLESGTISGNRTTRGGGIHNHSGTVTINGGKIEGNKATSLGGGIDALSGTTYINGGEIIDNTCENAGGGGIAVSTKDTHFSGSPVVKGNKAKGGDSNVYASVSAILQIDGPIGKDAEICVLHAMNARVDEPVTITNGFPGNGDLEAFKSDEEYYKGYDANGELVFGKVKADVTYESGEGAEEEAGESITWAKDSYLTLPECKFTPKEGNTFRGWEIGNQIYQPGDKVQITGDTTITAKMGSAWNDLQKQIDDLYGQDETTITLNEDLTAAAGNEALHVKSGVRVILDLNGHTINRNLQEPAKDGSVIVVDGRLTVIDSSEEKTGTITGGNTTGDGGGIINNSTLKLNGGTVAGNYAQGNGGGIFSSSTLNIEGGTVSGNEAGGLGGGVYSASLQNTIIYSGTITDNKAGENAGGVWFESGGNQGTKGVLIIDGRAVITGNTVNGNANNVYLHGVSKLSITQRFDRESLIGVTTEEKPEEGTAVDVTKTNKGRSDASNIISDDPQYGIFQELESEAMLVVPVKVRFESGHEDATGEMLEVTAGKGVEYTAPSCGFDLVGGAFAGWYVNGDTETIVKKGEKLTFNEDAVLTAAWDVSEWKALQSRIDHAADGDTVRLDKDVEALSDDGALYVASDKNIILDLNGHTIDRKLSEKEAVRNGYVIKVDGKLTILDSSEEKTGTITGGNDVSTGAQADAAGGILLNRGELILKSGTISGNRTTRGGGIHNHYGTLTIEGGTIENNTATSLGGGIDASSGTTYIKGGSIINNTSGQLGGGVMISTNSTYFSGKPVIKDNTGKDGADNNVYASISAVLQIDGQIEKDAEICVLHAMNARVDEPVTITNGFPGNGDLEAFKSDEEYYKGYDANGELVFGKEKAAVTYESGEGAAEEASESIIWAKDSYLILPECKFTPKEGNTFRGWETGSQVYQPGDKVQITGDTTIAAKMGSLWQELQTEISEAADGDTITLTEDVSGTEVDEALVVDDGKMIRIDLNGHTINRNLKDPAENGSVLVNNGSLTIIDSSEDKTGAFTGGNTTGNGGGIINNAMLTINSGSIIDNHADGNGGGIFNTGVVYLYDDVHIENNAAGQSGGGVYIETSSGKQTGFTMYAGTIGSNTAAVSGGGVYGDGFFNISGESYITGNTVNGKDNNLYVAAEGGQPKFEHIINSLDEKARVGISSEIKPETGSPVTVIKSKTGDFSIRGLYSDDPAYTIISSDDFEAQLAVGVKVTFDKGNSLAEGEMDPVTVAAGLEYTVPECRFTMEDEPFAGWMIDRDPDKLVAAGDKLIPEKDITLTALWGESPWKELQKKIDNASNGDVIVLDDDVRAMPMDVPLIIPEGRSITIDLNGHAIDRHLTAKRKNGSVMSVKGTLTVKDSGEGGKITGANNDSGDSDMAGAVNVTGGTFILESGSISGNWSFYSGGVHPADGGTFIMEGGSIEDNEAWLAGAVIVDRATVVDIRGGTITNNRSDKGGAIAAGSGTLNISGNPVISGNTTGGKEVNVDLGRAVINVPVELDESASIGVNGTHDGVITDGLPGHGVIENFISDNEKAIGYTEDGEAMLGEAVDVSFEANGGSGTMEAVKVAKNSYYALPKNEFTAPESTSFDSWSNGTDTYSAGTRVKIDNNTVFTAQWKDDPKANLTVHWSSGDGTDLKAPLMLRAQTDSTFGDVIGTEAEAITSYFSTEGYTAAEVEGETGLFLPKPVRTYVSMEEAKADRIDMKDQLDGDRDIYYVLFKEQKELTISVDPAACGTDMAASTPSARADSASNSDLIGAAWISSGEDHSAATGTLKGGDTAYMDFVLAPKPGIAFSKDPDVTISGGEKLGQVVNEDGTARITVSAAVEHVPGEIRKENEREATCIEAGGYEENVYCTQDICGHVKLSSEFVETEPAMGHKWGEPSFRLSADKKYMIARRECEHQTTTECTEVEQAAITHSVVTKQATCEENGETTYTSAPFVDPDFGIQSITVADIEKKGHFWDAPVYEWSDDFSTVTASRICKNDFSHFETETVETEVIGETKATCTEDGELTYLAVFENEAFDQQIRTEVIPATGHDWADPVYEWSDDNSSVTAERTCRNDAAHKETETAAADSKVTKPATCTEKGETTYTAEFENSVFETQTKTVADIDATGHSWDEGKVTKEPSCEETGVMTYTCLHDDSHSYTEEIDALGHSPADPVEETIKEATCTEDGSYDTVIRCERCEKELARDNHPKPALGHEWGEWEVVTPATEEAEGLEKRECSRCHKVEERAIPPVGHVHKTKYVDAIESTCTATGVKEHYECEGCGRYFLDEAGQQEVEYEELITETAFHAIEQSQEGRIEPTCTNFGYYYEVRKCTTCGETLNRTRISIPKLGHKWGEAEYSWSDDNSTVTAKKTCENDTEHVVTETADTTSSVAVQPTCTEKGSTEYTAQFADPAFETQRKTVEDVDPLGHDYGEPEYIWAYDNRVVTARMTCGRCGDPVEETAIVSQEIVKDPTCTEKGSTKYIAEFTDPAFETQTKTLEDIVPTGHSWDEGKVTKEPTCEEPGIKTYTCQHDDSHSYTEEIDALGHSPVETEETIKEATCTEDGSYDTVIKCERCEKELARDNHLKPALGHEWGEWTVVKEPTETEDGEKTRECSRCGETETRAIPAEGHVHDLVFREKVEPGCTTTGLKEHYECTKCGLLYLDEEGRLEARYEDLIIDAKGHSVVRTQEEGSAATCTKPGYYYVVVTCEVCGEVISRTPVIQPKGHKWGEAEYRWSDDLTTVTAESICENDSSHVLSETAEVVRNVTKEATCTEEGEIVYTATFSNEVFAEQTRTEAIEATGHDWGTPTYTWSDDNSTVTAQRICKHDGSHVISETVNTTVSEKAATCEDAGERSYTAVFSDPDFVKQTKTVRVSGALGHKWGDWKVTKAATATAKGTKTRECSRCHRTETQAIPAKGYAPGADPNQKGKDGTAVGPGASAAAAEKAIMNSSSEEGPAGTTYAPLKLKSTRQTKNSIKLTWTKSKKARKYVIYGNMCGKKNKMKKIATSKGKVRTIKKVAGKKLKKGKYYKFIIFALDKNNNVVSTSRVVHVATKGGKVGNHKSVTVKKAVITKAKKVKKGKTLKLNAKAVKASKKTVKIHRAVRYESSNKKIATVSKKGVVKGKKKGTCYIYAYAQNGVFRKIKITVK